MKNILKRNEDYTIYRDKSSQVQKRCRVFEMWGRFMDGSWFIMQCPYASITESASLANRFFDLSRMYRNGLSGGLLVWMFFPKYYKTDHGTCRIIPGDGKLKISIPSIRAAAWMRSVCSGNNFQ